MIRFTVGPVLSGDTTLELRRRSPAHVSANPRPPGRPPMKIGSRSTIQDGQTTTSSGMRRRPLVI